MNDYSGIILSDDEKETWQLLKKSNRVVITSHVHPDGDAIGSCIALLRYCISNGVEAKIFIDDHIPDIYDYLPDVKLIGTPEGEIVSDVLVIVDTDARRIGLSKAIITDEVINIDHHETNPRECAHSIIREKMTSTAELLYRIFMREHFVIDPVIANCLYTGLITDTVFFKIPMETPDAFFIAGELAQKGAECALISQRLSKKSLKEFRMTVRAFDKLECFRNNTVIGITMDEAFDELELSDEIVDNIRYLDGVDVAFLLKHENGGGYRARIRSQVKDVSSFAKKHGGGGHPDAAGFTINIDDAELARKTLLEDLLKWLE